MLWLVVLIIGGRGLFVWSFFEVWVRPTQQIQTTFASIFDLFWAVFLSEDHKKKLPNSTSDPRWEDHGLSTFLSFSASINIKYTNSAHSELY